MPRFISVFTLTLFFIFSNAFVCASAPISALEGLEILRKGFAGTDDFTAEISQEKQISIMKKTLHSSGIIKFRKPGNFLMELKPPYASKLLIKGNIVEQKNLRDNSINRIVLPPDQSIVKWFDKLSAPVTTLPEGVDIKAERNGALYSLQIVPVKRNQLKKITITYQPDGTIRKITLEEYNGNRSSITLSRFRKNTGLSDSELTL